MPSLHRRIASRLRFQEYLRHFRSRLKSGVERTAPTVRRPRGRAPLAARLYRELLRALERPSADHRPGAGRSLSVATLLKLIPPAATKAAIDYVMLARPLPSGGSGVESRSRSRSRRGSGCSSLVGVVIRRLGPGHGLGLWSRWLATRTTKRVQVAVRRKVYEHAMRLPLHRVYQLKSGGASSLLREDAGGVGELIFSMLYNPWSAVVQFLGGLVVLAWVDWRLLAGRAAASCRGSIIPT